ncbi:hypothetical protein Tco_0627763, partial [Tanacetum coccineum]
FDYREENGESEEESSNEDKGIEDDSEDKMHINENKKIRTRSFVGYKINRFPTALARWLLLNYDPTTSVLQAGDVKIKITSQTIHDIFGLPMRGKEIVELNQAKKTDEVIEEWRGTDIKKLDWCGYLLKCLKRTKTLWKGGFFNGPSTFLTVLYAQKCMLVVLKRSSTTVITKWTARKLIMFQKEMIASNKKIIAPDTDIESHEITLLILILNLTRL